MHFLKKFDPNILLKTLVTIFIRSYENKQFKCEHFFLKYCLLYCYERV